MWGMGLLCMWCALLVATGCGADIDPGEETGVGEPYQVTIWNRSQFELRAVKLSNFRLSSSSSAGVAGNGEADQGGVTDMGQQEASPDVRHSAWAYGERDLVTLEDRPLGQEETLVVEGFVSGATLSVMRDRAAGAGLLEVSSAQGFYPDADGYTIIVFDDTFRLLAPWSSDNPYGP